MKAADMQQFLTKSRGTGAASTQSSFGSSRLDADLKSTTVLKPAALSQS
jgi:hypothetical protein